MFAIEEDEKEKQEKREVWLGTVKIFHSIKIQAPPKKPSSSSLPFGEVNISNTKLYALVDMSALNMFMSSEAAKSSGL